MWVGRVLLLETEKPWISCKLGHASINAYESNYKCEQNKGVLMSNALKLAHTPWPSLLCFHTDAVIIHFHCKSSVFAQSLKQKSWLDSSNSQGAAESNYRASGWKSYSQGLFLTLPLIKARLTNKMNHAPLFLKPQHFGESSQTTIVRSLHVHLTAENNNGSDFHIILAGGRLSLKYGSVGRTTHKMPLQGSLSLSELLLVSKGM